MTLEALKETTDLNIIIDKMMKSGESAPEFTKKYEKYAMDRIEIYTAKVSKRIGFELQDTVEEYSGELMDCISEINRAYYKNGMNAGAVLLLQLMGF